MKIDTLLRCSEVFDGEKIDSDRLQVGISGATIVHVGPLDEKVEADEIVDLDGLILAPGFIDTHASTGLGYTRPQALDNKAFQGITTEIIGNCGTSVAPIGDALVTELQAQSLQIGFDFNWRSLADWIKGVEKVGIGINAGTFIGHSTLRGGVAGYRRQLEEADEQKMHAMLEQAMKDGALGMSTGLIYAPGSFAEFEEIATLAETSARNGGLYVSHVRNERQDLVAAIEEALAIGKRAGCRVLVSHLKSAEKKNWGRIPQVIAMIEGARTEGLDVSFEVYPYSAVSTKLKAFIPSELIEGGLDAMVQRLNTEAGRVQTKNWLVTRKTDFSSMILITDSFDDAKGKSIKELAEVRNREPADLAVDLLITDPDTWIIYHCLSQKDVDTAVLHPLANICSDSWSYPVNAATDVGQPHPRTYGALTRFLERYAIREAKLSLGEAIRKITSLPANVLGFSDRGRIKTGCAADLVVLDRDGLKERATYAEPRQFSEGTIHLWVNGEPVIRDGSLTGNLAGRILRRQK